MEQFFIYLLKSCAWTSAFWLVYRLFLRDETFLGFNRRFLITGVVLSFILPSLQFYYPEEVAPVSSAASGWLHAAAVTGQLPAAKPFGWLYVAAAIYAAGIIFLLARSLRELFRIRKLISTYGYGVRNGYRLVDVRRPIAPFSFLNYIFLDTGRLSATERGIIIAHESSHIREKHWVDLAMGGTLKIVQWFNPFAYLLTCGIRDNHEFMADRHVLDRGGSKAQYKAILVNATFGERVFTLGHPFSASNNLKRYKMMNKKVSSASRKWSALAILPLAALFFTAFAKPKYIEVEIAAPESIPASQSEAAAYERLPLTAPDAVAPPVAVEKHGSPIADSTRQSGAEKKHPMITVDGLEVSEEEFAKMDPGDIQSLTILKDASALALYGSRAEGGIIIAVTKGKSGENTIPADSIDKGTLKNRPQSQAFQLKAGVSDFLERIEMPEENTEKTPLFIVNDTEVNPEIARAIDVQMIESVTVLKDEAAMKIYGEKARNGVVVIKLGKHK